jgi:hypothetical protein
MDPLTNNIGATVPILSIKTCVVYDEASGRIHHHHSVLTLVGGREPSEEEIAKDALRALSHQQRATAPKMRVLHVAHNELARDKRYRVNHAEKALIRTDTES